jgi:hypothetical protein
VAMADSRTGGFVFRSDWEDAAAFVATLDLSKGASTAPVTSTNFTIYGPGELKTDRWTGYGVSPFGVMWLPRLDLWERRMFCAWLACSRPVARL